MIKNEKGRRREEKRYLVLLRFVVSHPMTRPMMLSQLLGSFPQMSGSITFNTLESQKDNKEGGGGAEGGKE